MALKGDRLITQFETRFGCLTVSERGVVTVYGTANVGSGAAIGLTAGYVDVLANPSGKVPVGVLLNDVVNLDQTRFHRNFHKDETQVNEPVALCKQGYVTTNMITGTPTVGATAYLTASGVITPTVSATGGTAATPKVGIFSSIKDELGYATIEVNLPIV